MSTSRVYAPCLLLLAYPINGCQLQTGLRMSSVPCLWPHCCTPHPTGMPALLCYGRVSLLSSSLAASVSDPPRPWLIKMMKSFHLVALCPFPSSTLFLTQTGCRRALIFFFPFLLGARLMLQFFFVALPRWVSAPASVCMHPSLSFILWWMTAYLVMVSMHSGDQFPLPSWLSSTE